MTPDALSPRYGRAMNGRSVCRRPRPPAPTGSATSARDTPAIAPAARGYAGDRETSVIGALGRDVAVRVRRGRAVRPNGGGAPATQGGRPTAVRPRTRRTRPTRPRTR